MDINNYSQFVIPEVFEECFTYEMQILWIKHEIDVLSTGGGSSELELLKNRLSALETGLVNLSADVENDISSLSTEILTTTSSQNTKILNVEQEISNLFTAVSEIRNSIDAKQDLLTFDSSPTLGSNNPVTSNGICQLVYDTENRIDTALSSKVENVTFESAVNDINLALTDAMSFTEFNTNILPMITSKQNKLDFDTSPIFNSTNPVTSGGIFESLYSKQNTLTFDSTPTQGSTNPVTSNGVYQAIQSVSGGGSVILDDTVTEESSNGVKSSGIYLHCRDVANSAMETAINIVGDSMLPNYAPLTSTMAAISNKQDILTFDSTPTLNSTNPVTSGGVATRANNMEYALNSKINTLETNTGSRFNLVESNINLKQNILTFDTTPTQGSSNPVKSDGVNKILTGDLAHTTLTVGTRASASTVGTNSVAEGNLTTASNANTHAEGDRTVASGLAAHAEGALNTSSGIYTHSEGYGTVAGTGTASVSSNTDAGNFAHAEGNGTKSTGNSAHSEGKGTLSSAIGSHAEGLYSIASGNGSHAEGGTSTASGSYSHSEGSGTVAGSTGTATSSSDTTAGYFSHAEGNGTKASGNSSHSEGKQTVASAIASHAEGAFTTASGAYSHAEGNTTTASGAYSHAEGVSTSTDSADGSHIMGKYGVANTPYAWHLAGGTDASNQDISIKLATTTFGIASTGTGYANSWATTGADYAEMFEWADGNLNDEDRIGLLVAFDSTQPSKIKIANSTDEILGVVSGTAGIIGDNYEINWSGKCLYDEFGRKKLQHITIPDVLGEDGGVIIPGFDGETTIVNPDYDPEITYIPREQRAEWDAIGFMGKLYVKDDGTCVPGSKCKASDNGFVTSSSEGYHVLERIKELSDDGYGVVRIFIK